MDPLPGSFLSMHPNTFLSQWCLRIKLLLTQMVVMVSLAHLEVLLLASTLMSLATVVMSTKGKIAQPDHASEQEIIAQSTKMNQ